MRNKKLILCWQEPNTREWIAIGRLWRDENQYKFCYTKGLEKAQESGFFNMFEKMDEKDQVYISDDLFPNFKNRLLQKSRPEYQDYLRWLGFSKPIGPLVELSRTNGERATDSLQLFEIPEKQNEKYIIYFFIHGIRHQTQSAIHRIGTLQRFDKLYLVKDIQNEADFHAFALRTSNPPERLGYCPRIYSTDISYLLEKNGPQNLITTIETVSPDAPLQLMVLCKLETDWPVDFTPFSQEDFQPYSFQDIYALTNSNINSISK